MKARMDDNWPKLSKQAVNLGTNPKEGVLLIVCVKTRLSCTDLCDCRCD